MVNNSILWYSSLYVDPSIAEKIEQMKKSVEEGKPLLHIYCVVFASNPSNLFDVMSVNELQFPYYKRKTMKILGVAGSRTAAINLAVQMIEDIYAETAAFAVKDYFCFE